MTRKPTYEDLEQRIRVLEEESIIIKEAEDSLRESEEKYRILLSESPDPTFSFTPEGQYRYVNRAFAEGVGKPVEDIIGKSIWDVFPKEEADKRFDSLSQVFRTGKEQVIEVRVPRADGDRYYITAITLIKDTKGEILSAICSSKDITERKQMEYKLFMAHNDLEKKVFERTLELAKVNEVMHTEILERMKSETALQESEEKYRNIFNNAIEGIYRSTPEGRYIIVNPAFAQMCGYDSPEEITVSCTDIAQQLYVNPEERELLSRLLYKNGNVKNFETQFYKKDGGKIWVSCSACTVKDAEGNILHFDGMIENITTRKQAQEALRESELKYRLLIEHSSDVVFCVDQNGEYKFVNQVFASTFGKTPDYFLGKTFWDIYPKEHADHRQAASSRVFATGESQSVDVVVPLPDRTLYFIAKANPVRDETGKVVLNLTHATDITERKRAEEALRESEERYRTLADAGWEGLVFYKDGVLIDANESFLKMFGYSYEEITGKSVLDFLAPESVEPALQKIAEYSSGGQSYFEAKGLRKDQIIISVEMLGKPIRHKNHDARVLAIRDITDLKHAEEHLHQTLDRLKAAFGTIIQVMVTAVESRDPYTAGHQNRSADLARAIATEMGLSQDKIDGISMAGSIHDIGKLSTPAEILAKPTKLSEIELPLVKQHAQKGYEMLKDVESPWPLAEMVYQHHERMDGSGYPRNLKGAEILIEARILAVADVVESMASHRPYRPALGLDAALEEIENNKGTLYDADAVDACLILFREKGYQLEGT